MKTYFNIRFETRDRKGAWVTGAKFADGLGYKVKSVSLGRVQSEAAPMSRMMAEAIAVQYCNSVVTIHTSDGQLHEEATAFVTESANKARWANARARAEFNAMLADAFNSIPSLRKVLGM